MNDSEKVRVHARSFQFYAWVVAIVWTAVVAASLMWNVVQIKQYTLEAARIQARSAFEKDVLYRRWNAEHGGVYAPVTEVTKPNPFLSDLPERDMTTSLGKPLTLINPAHMTRQVHELAKEKYGVRGHITSLNPIRPENAPDPWETGVLQAFERGETETSSVKKMEGEKYMRLMRPLITEKSCLQCHAVQGYQEGDIRGGISVSVPMETLLAVAGMQGLTLAVGHILLWLLVLGGIVLGTQRLRRSEREHNRAAKELRKYEELEHLRKAEEVAILNKAVADRTEKLQQSDGQVRLLLDSTAEAIYGLDLNGNCTFANRACIKMIGGRDAAELLGKNMHELIHHSHQDSTPYPIQDCHIFRAFRKGENVHIDDEVLWRTDGTSFPAEYWSYPIFIEDQVVGSVVTFLDISERKQFEAALRFKNQAFEDSVAALSIADADGIITEVNPAFLTLWGHRSKEDAVGQSVGSFFVNREDAGPVLEALGTSGRWEGEFLARRADDSTFISQGLATAMKNDRGELIGYQSANINVTEIRRAEDALRESEKNLKNAQKVAHVGFWDLNISTGKLYWSDETFRIYGFKPLEFEPSSEKFQEILYPDDHERIQAAMDAAFSGTAEYDIDFRFLRPDGNIGWIHCCGEVTRDAEGKPVRFFGTQIDITERKNAEKEIQESEAKWRSLAENTPDTIITMDRDGTVLFINRTHSRVASEQVIGTSIFEHTPSEYHDTMRKSIAQVFETGDSGSYEVVTEGGGITSWYESRVGPLMQDGVINAAILVRTDITERKQLQAQIAQSDRLASMGMLAAGVAHEINNPLVYVLYNLESLTDDLPRLSSALTKCLGIVAERLGDDEWARLMGSDQELLNPVMLDDIGNRFKEALSGSNRIKGTVRGLSTFSRVEEDRLVPVNLMHLFEVAINMVFNEIKYRARLIKEYGKISTIMANEGRLSQVFLNLLINAAHSIDEGDVENNKIRIRTWQEKDEVFAEIRDTGKGIAKEHMVHLFEPFFTTKEIGTGTGLGLSISKNIIESYGGQIEVTSEVSKGTSFIIRLPVREAEETSEALPTKKAPTETIVRGRILIIDDEPGIRSSVKRMLREHEIVQAASGDEGRQILEKDQEFDLVLCDMMMPIMSGVELHEWISETHPQLANQVVFITGGAFTPKAREYLTKVSNLRVDKPFDSVNFKKLVSELILAARTKK